MRYWFIVACEVVALVAATAAPAIQQPAGTGIVCAIKAGSRRSYWTAQAAAADGAIVLYAGECPWPSGGGEGP
jgi:hypothetical protein